MSDPLAQIITLLRPEAVGAKEITAAGRWSVQYENFHKPAFGAMLEGQCRLTLEGEAPLLLEAGDFLLLPATPSFTFSGLEPGPLLRLDPAVEIPVKSMRHGRQDGPPEMRQFGGWFSFGAPDAALLVSLLPRMILLRGVPRLTRLVRLLGDEALRDDIGRELILQRLVEILLIEALRALPGQSAEPGLLRGLEDPRIGTALRALHADVARPWTVPQLAREAGMSRSAFFERFTRLIGLPPMEYLLAWRMALAKDLLRRGGIALDEVARRIGYGSSSTFSTAFSRHSGEAPGRFMRAARDGLATPL